MDRELGICVLVAWCGEGSDALAVRGSCRRLCLPACVVCFCCGSQHCDLGRVASRVFPGRVFRLPAGQVRSRTAPSSCHVASLAFCFSRIPGCIETLTGGAITANCGSDTTSGVSTLSEFLAQGEFSPGQGRLGDEHAELHVVVLSLVGGALAWLIWKQKGCDLCGHRGGSSQSAGGACCSD